MKPEAPPSRTFPRIPGPLFWNEMRYLFLRNPSTGWVLGAFAILCGIVFCLGTAGWFNGVTEDSDPPARRLFFITSVLILAFVVVMGPVYSGGAFIEEKDRRTFDLLWSSGLSPGELILGKVLSALVRTLAGIVAGAPCLLISLALGGVSAWDLVKHLVFFSAIALTACSVGVFLSMLFRSALLTRAVTLLILFYMFFASIVLTFFIYVLLTWQAGVPYPGFWGIATTVNLGLSFFLCAGGILLFGRLARWDY